MRMANVRDGPNSVSSPARAQQYPPMAKSMLGGLPGLDLFSLSRDEIQLLAASQLKRHRTLAQSAAARLEQELTDFEQWEASLISQTVPLPAVSASEVTSPATLTPVGVSVNLAVSKPLPASPTTTVAVRESENQATNDFDEHTANATSVDFDLSNPTGWAGFPVGGDEPSFLLRTGDDSESEFPLDITIDNHQHQHDPPRAALGHPLSPILASQPTSPESPVYPSPPPASAPAMDDQDATRLSSLPPEDSIVDESTLEHQQPAGPSKLMQSYFPALAASRASQQQQLAKDADSGVHLNGSGPQPPPNATPSSSGTSRRSVSKPRRRSSTSHSDVLASTVPPTSGTSTRMRRDSSSSSVSTATSTADIQSMRDTLSRERAVLEREKVALDKAKLDLRAEKKEFESWRLAETAALAEEKRKVKRDRMLVDKQRKVALEANAQLASVKRDKQELDEVRRQLDEARAQVKSTMAKAKLTEDRLKKRVDELMRELKEKAEEIKMLESERASAALMSASASAANLSSRRSAGTASPPPERTPNMPHAKRLSTQSSASTSASTVSTAALPMSPRMLRQLAGSPPPSSSAGAGAVASPALSVRSAGSSSAASMSTGSMQKPRAGMQQQQPPYSAMSVSSVSSPGSVISAGQLTPPLAGAPARNRIGSQDDGTDGSVLSSMTHAAAVSSDVGHWRSHFAAVEKLGNLGTHITEKSHRDGIRERRYANGTRVVVYKNGTTKEYQMSGAEITRYTNRDVKQVLPDGKFVYYFADKDVTQTTFPDGMSLTEFADGQTEKKYPDGMTEIVFPNQSIRYIYPTGEKEDIFPDGTMEKTDAKGNKTVIHSDGSKEIWTKDKKKRIMPNGEVKVVFADGTRQKILPDGRMRIVDPRGRIIKDEIGADG